MKYPIIVEHETTYFEITLFPENGNGTTLTTCYKTFENARKAARRELKKENGFKSATIRFEEVWKRNENCEFSSSSPVLEYTRKNGKTAFRWITKNPNKFIERK